jgi:NAD(P)-dependent dehydrogenase (short-subunit alcohol dehydrogenase family)
MVTGAGSGIGAATALALGVHGARVLVCDINDKSADRVADRIRRGGGIAVSRRVDVSDAASVEASVGFALDTWGVLHHAVNNAGIGGGNALTADYSLESWSSVIATNLSGVFFGLKYQLPALIRSGGGSIVNVSSVLGRAGAPMVAAYVAAKHGVLGLTKTAALEYATQGIRVNSVGPGYIDTPLLNALEDESYEHAVALHPVGRLGNATEVAELALFLMSERASFITGSHHAVDGGYGAR